MAKGWQKGSEPCGNRTQVARLDTTTPPLVRVNLAEKTVYYSFAASRDCCQLGNALCLCLPVRPAQAVPERRERGPKSLAIDIAVKTFDSSLIALESDCQMIGTGRQGLELGLKLELCRLTNGL